jgi:ArsR family transcriptional regulator
MVDTLERTTPQESFVALADPTRLAILTLLRTRDHCVCHLVEQLGLKQSVVSHHVGILRRAGVITSHPNATDRRWLYYRLNRAALAEVARAVSWLLDDAAYDPTPLPCGADAAAAEVV